MKQVLHMKIITILVIALVYGISNATSSLPSSNLNKKIISKTRGVHPKDMSKYQPKNDDTFTCKGSSTTTEEKIIIIPSSSINDDFCDCTLDGLDEPGTSACSYLKTSRFHCKANPSKSFYIFTSRVDDGICDCCDGEDEMDIICPNNCKALAIQMLQTKKEKASKFIEGLKIRETYVKKAKSQLNNFVKERESLHRQTKSIDLNMPRLEQIAERYKEIEDSYKKQIEYRAEMNYIRKIKLRQLDLNTLRTILLPNLCIQGGKSGMEALMEQYKIDIVVEENKNSTIYQLFFQQFINNESSENSDEEGKEDLGFQLIDLVMDNNNNNKKKDETTTNVKHGKYNDQMQKTALLHHIMEIARKTNHFEYLALISLEEYENIQSKIETEKVSKLNVFQGLLHWFMKDDVKEYDHTIEQYAKELSKSLDDPGKDFKHSMALSSKSNLEYAQRIKSTLLSDHNSLVNMGKTDFGEGNAYLSMYNECFSKKAGKYKYNICPFKRADQDGTALGHFDSLYSKGGSGKANMIYKNGRRCPGGQQRELKVVFYCGKENEITSVSEPSPCSYVAKFVSPAVCGEQEKRFVENVQELIKDAGLEL